MLKILNKKSLSSGKFEHDRVIDSTTSQEKLKEVLILPDINEPKKRRKSRRNRSNSASSKQNNVADSQEITLKRESFKSKSLRDLNTDSLKSVDSKVSKNMLRNRNAIRLYDAIPAESMPPLHITNQDEVKRNFLELNLPPVLKFKADNLSVQNILTRHNKPSFHYFFRAKNILDFVKSKFHKGFVDEYFEANFGERIKSKECVDIIDEYLKLNNISGDVTINFAPGLTCSGRIISYNMNKKKPDKRKYAIWINDGDDNQFLRKKGIISLLDHELGTHYYRSFNDGWVSDQYQFQY